jgi:hypothetical protein
MRERFPDRNNRENNRDSDRRNFSNIGHLDRKHGLDNTVAMADKTKKFQNSRGSKTLRICIVYDTRKETTQQEIAESSFIGKQEKEKIRIRKRITRRKTKTIRKTKDSSSQREQLQ